MDLALVFDELERRAGTERVVTEADVKRWSTGLGVTRDVLYDAIAANLALGFHRRQLTLATTLL